MAKYKPIRIGDVVPLQQIAASEEVDAKVYVSQSAVVLGRTTAGDGPHEEILISSLPGGGGAASIIDITYADMQTAIAGSTLTEGQFYRITNASGTNLGFVCQAVKTNEITVSGTGGFLNADFQAVGDYANTPEVFNAQLGIWRAGFETVTIPYTNLQFPPDYVSYSTSSGLLDPAETFTTDLGTTGTVILDDGAGTVTVESLSQALVAGEIITGDTSGNTVTVDSYTVTVKTFQVGDTITGQTTGATAVIVTDDGSTSMTAYMTSAGVTFDGSEVLDNGAGVTADQDGAAGSPTIVQGDVVIWNLLHWQLTDAALLDGTNPETNTAAYTILAKGDYPETYVVAWDIAEFDFPNNNLVLRSDTNGNYIKYGISTFSFGNPNFLSNRSYGGSFYLQNFLGSVTGIVIEDTGVIGCDHSDDESYFTNINIGTNASVSTINLFGESGITTCDLSAAASINNITCGRGTVIENNIIENGASLTGITTGANCSISRNKIGQGATLGVNTTMGDGAQITDNSLESAANMVSNTFADSVTVFYNTIGPTAYVGDNIIGSSTALSYNILNAGGSIESTETEDNCQITQNTIEPNASFTDNYVSSGNIVSNNAIYNGVEISNKTFSNFFSRNKIGRNFTNTKTFSDQVSDRVLSVGLSTFYESVDITGVTTADFSGLSYVGIYNLTSTNATETLDTVTNFPTLFPFRLAPAPGLTLTVTGTAIAGIGAGQIALTTADVTLIGDNGEYLELVCDATNTYLIEKSRVAGIL